MKIILPLRKSLLMILIVLIIGIAIKYIPPTIRWIDAHIAFMMAREALVEGEMDQGLRLLNRTVELNPSHSEAYELMAWIYYEQRRWQDAATAYEAAINAGNEDPMLYNNLGWTLIEYDLNYEKGMIYAEKSLKLRPNDPYTEDTLGWGYYKLGDYEQALYWVERAATKAPYEKEIVDHYDQLVDLVKKTMVDSTQAQSKAHQGNE